MNFGKLQISIIEEKAILSSMVESDLHAKRVVFQQIYFKDSFKFQLNNESKVIII